MTTTNKYVTINRGKLLNLLKEPNSQVIRIYLTMLAVAGDQVHDPTGFMMTIEDIVEFSGVSRSSVFRHLRTMESNHWIRAERSGGAGNNIYHLESPE